MSDVPPQSPYGSAPPPPPGGSSGYPPPPPPGAYPPPPPGYQQPGGYYPPAAGAGSQWGVLAEWPPRALGFVIDGAVGAVLVIAGLILGAILSIASHNLLVLGYAVGWLASLAWSVLVAVQIGQTGTSPGMRVAGVRCISKTTGAPIGVGMSILRTLVHAGLYFLCVVPYIVDMLFPLWDPEKQTLADKIVGTVVVNAPKQRFSVQPTAGSY